MIHVKVTKADIYKGRTNASEICGCPVWHALNRSLRKVTANAEECDLLIRKTSVARFGKWKFHLPDDAVEFQEVLMRDFSAEVEPFEFDVDVSL